MARRLFGTFKEASDEPPPESQKKTEIIEVVPTGPAPPTTGGYKALSGAETFGELEQKIKERNERFRIENEALKRENRRLKALLDKKQEDGRKAGPDAS